MNKFTQLCKGSKSELLLAFDQLPLSDHEVKIAITKLTMYLKQNVKIVEEKINIFFQ